MTDIVQIQIDAYAFSKAIRCRLDKEMREKQFTTLDFYYLAELHSKTRRDISSVLNRLYKDCGLLRVVKSTARREGGGAEKTYAVIKNASFEIKTPGARKKEACNKIKTQEEKSAQCVRSLEKAMNKFVNVVYETR